MTSTQSGQRKSYSIRRYFPEDRYAVRELFADTAFFGDPLEAFFEDRQLFTDLFTTYYTDFEPDSLFVTEFGDRVGGYLMGCLDTRRQGRLWRGRIMPGVVGRTLQGRYRLGRQALGLGLRGAQALLKGDFVGADHKVYPAHLHINLATRYRGQGAGRALLVAYIDHLRANGVPGVHLETSTQNVAARGLYESLGFEVLSSRETGLWRGVIDGPVELLVYGKRL
jgi:ribosomal protein S18 acetylase RimI-like enzyme